MTNAWNRSTLIRYVECHELLRRGFPWEYTLARQFGALLLAGMPFTPTVEGIKDMRAHMRHETSVFSGFRGVSELLMAMMLYREPNGRELFDRTLLANRLLREAGFRGTTYMPLAAMTLARNYQADRLAEGVARTEQFYLGMKVKHLLITGQDDYVYAVLLASSGRPVESTLAVTEQLYRELSVAGLPRGNGLQSLSHVLALGDEPVGVMVERAVRLYRYLSSRRYRMKEYRMPFLGVLALVSATPELLADGAIQLEEELRTIRGFGNFSCDRNTRFMLAGSLLVEQQLGGMANEIGRTALANSIQAILLAQQAATMAAIIAASSSAAAASSGG